MLQRRLHFPAKPNLKAPSQYHICSQEFSFLFHEHLPEYNTLM